MATPYQPLSDGSIVKRNLPCKIILLCVSLVAIASSIAFVATKLPTTTTPPLAARLCEQAHDRNSCMAMVAEVAPSGTSEFDSVQVMQMFLQKTALRIKHAMDSTKSIHGQINNQREQAALADCLELMDVSTDRLLNSIKALNERTTYAYTNAHTWLSSVLTNHVTCLDGLNGPTRSKIELDLNDLIARARASLSMIVAIISQPKTDELLTLHGKFPSWVTSSDRKLLESSFNAAVNANVVVAKDGSGNYKTIKEAVASAPDNGKNRYVIWVKQGTYKENIDIGKAKKNIMLTGDGMSKTIITGSLNVIDGSTTFKSATVAANGDGFMAQDIWFQNTAGPSKEQAVALRVSADQSVINRCKIDAYQDTLYAHSLRQFYRDCYITGTVDFIFGNAAVVFQNSQIVARKPMDGQNNMITAQGRTDKNSNTGTSVQNCDVIASSDLQPVIGTIKTYLGRPWKEYSRTVFMESNLGSHIDPAGWSPWDGDFALSTLYYGEYMNSGPGAGTSKRVKWPGYHVITSADEASKFTVAQLIQGGQWLKNTGVSYTEGL